MAGIINSSVLLPAGVMGGGGGVKAGGPQTKRWRGREGTSLDGGALPPFSRLLGWRSPRLGWEGGAQVRKLWSQSSPVHIHSAGRLLGTSGGPGPSTHLSLTNGSLLKLCKPGATRPPPPHLLSKLTIPRITKELPGFRKLVLNHRAGLLGPPYVRPHG